ncbi:MAG: agmatinase [Phycisphaerales bacterium]
MTPPFLDPPPFEGAPAIAVIPVPYDGSSTWVKGADLGPAAILDASAQVEWYDIQTRTEVHTHGIVTRDPVNCDGSPDELAPRVERAVGRELDAGRFPVVLGGEHSVSIGAFRAVVARHPDVTILQIDAHADTRERYHGSASNHACVMARAREMAPIVQVGIRSMEADEAERIDHDRVVYAHDIAGHDTDAWIERVTLMLTRKVYVTIDMDAFDPALVPATGTPEPGGLTWWQVDRLLRAVCDRSQVVGFDVVELCPSEGQHASDFVAAKLVHRFLSEIFVRR